LDLLRLNLYQLVVFYHVASEKSMTSAAEKLCLTQPAISLHIKSLEESVRMKLIEINRKKLSLTSNGEVLYHFCAQIYNQAMAAQRFVDLMTTNNLNVGVSPIFVSAIARTVQVLSNKVGSSSKVQLHFDGTAALIKGVIDSRLDLAVVPLFDTLTDDLNHVRLSEGKDLFFYASPTHPIFQKKQVEWQDFSNLTIVMGYDSPFLKKMILDKLVGEGIQILPRFNLAANNLECCKKMIQGGEGIGFALIEDISNEIKTGSIKTFALPEYFRIRIDAVFNKNFITSPLIRQFIECAKTTFIEDGDVHPFIN
jgi:DNA-binding transcriptional LysR family regulator